jgi:hypothetical protein
MSDKAPGTAKAIRLSAHAAEYMARRGFSREEVVETIRSSSWAQARGGRLEAARDFPYNAVWNGSYYSTKRVRPVFVDELEEIVVVTVYTYLLLKQ